MSEEPEIEGLESAIEIILSTDSRVVEEMSESIRKSEVRKIRRMAEVNS
jgi:hypothetical protein